MCDRVEKEKRVEREEVEKTRDEKEEDDEEKTCQKNSRGTDDAQCT